MELKLSVVACAVLSAFDFGLAGEKSAEDSGHYSTNAGSCSFFCSRQRRHNVNVISNTAAGVAFDQRCVWD